MFWIRWVKEGGLVLVWLVLWIVLIGVVVGSYLRLFAKRKNASAPCHCFLRGIPCLD